MSLKSISEGRKDIFLVKLENLREDPEQPRNNYGDLEGLAQSISKEGQKEPMKIRMGPGGEFAIIVNGHRRSRAIKIANEKYGASITSAKCIHEEKGANEETRLVSMLILNDGKPLEPLEEAGVYKTLINFNWDEKRIAEHTGKPLQYVKDRLGLNSAPKKIRDAVEKGRIKPTAAGRLARAPQKKQDEVLGEGEKKVSQKNVERATRGKQYNVSTKEIERKIKAVKELQKNAPLGKRENWEFVVMGLSLAQNTYELQDVLETIGKGG